MDKSKIKKEMRKNWESKKEEMAEMKPKEAKWSKEEVLPELHKPGQKRYGDTEKKPSHPTFKEPSKDPEKTESFKVPEKEDEDNPPSNKMMPMRKLKRKPFYGFAINRHDPIK